MIKLENISFTYQGQNGGMLRNVNLEIKAGECVLLCGRSGCGKTTVTRLINGLIPFFYGGELSGKVTLDGVEIKDIPMYELAKKIGSVFQNPRTQFFNVDTNSEIAFGIENVGLPFEELIESVDSTIKSLRIENLRDRNIFELSGGEKQKIAFASIYAMNPDIFLLDEPSSNLDMQSIEDLKEHIKFVKSKGKTVVVSEHRLYYLLDIADKIVYMESGEISHVFTSDELRKLSNDEISNMGLRSVDIERIKPAESEIKDFETTLSIKNFAAGYKNFELLHDINIEAGKGEVVAVAGKNGSGKTTFSRSLCGLNKYHSGKVFSESVEMSAAKRLELSYIVMQDVNYQLFAESLEKECTFGISNFDPILVDETMKKLGLYDFKQRHPNTLSGGQKQRTAVAVSMICGKNLLVFDEPTSGLDFDSMTQVAKVVRELSQMGKTIFIVTHDLEFICRACSRVIHIDDGTLAHDFNITEENVDKLRSLFEQV